MRTWSAVAALLTCSAAVTAACSSADDACSGETCAAAPPSPEESPGTGPGATSAPPSTKPTKPTDGGLHEDDDGGELPVDLPVDPQTGCSIVNDAPLATRNLSAGAANGQPFTLETYAEVASLGSTFVFPDGTVALKKGTIRFVFYRGPRGDFAPGTVDLACAAGTSCNGSVLYDRQSSQSYGIESGTVTIATAATPVSDELTGSLSRIIFRRMTLDGFLDPGGACFLVPAMAFDTRAPVGTPCTQANDCGSASKVCDPKALQCNVSLCSGDADCAPNESCLGAGGSNGVDPQGKACFPKCSPWAATCGAGFSCRYRTNTAGICLHASAAPKALGQTCSTQTFLNECGPGLTCTGVACAQACNHLSASPGCAASERCLSSDRCGTEPIALAVALGSSCALPAGVASLPCGDDGKAYRGICASLANPFGGPSAPPMCHRVCDPSAPSCAAGTSCQSLGAVSDAVCR